MGSAAVDRINTFLQMVISISDLWLNDSLTMFDHRPVGYHISLFCCFVVLLFCCLFVFSFFLSFFVYLHILLIFINGYIGIGNIFYQNRLQWSANQD